MPVRTVKAFDEALPELLAERGLSLRALARLVGVGDDHLSRALRHARGKRISPQLAGRVAVALGLPEDFFVETRLAIVIERLEDDLKLLDSVYDQIEIRPRHRRRTSGHNAAKKVR